MALEKGKNAKIRLFWTKSAARGGPIPADYCSLFVFESEKDAVYEYGIVYLKDSFYIIGGYWKSIEDASRTKIPSIARLDTKNFWSWSLAGKLNTPRAGHSAIVANSRLIVVGGRVSDLLGLNFRI